MLHLKKLLSVAVSLSLLAGPAGAVSKARVATTPQGFKALPSFAAVKGFQTPSNILSPAVVRAEALKTAVIAPAPAVKAVGPEAKKAEGVLKAVTRRAAASVKPGASAESAASGGSDYDGGGEGATASVPAAGSVSQSGARLSRAPARRGRMAATAAGFMVFSASPAMAQDASSVETFLRGVDTQDPMTWIAGAAIAGVGALVVYGAATLYRRWKFSNMSPHELQAELRSMSWRNRRLAIETYARKKRVAEVVSMITQMAGHDEKPQVQLAAIEALGEAKERSAVSALTGVLGDERKTDGVRAASARALGDIGDSRAGAPLLKFARDERADGEIRGAAIEALGVLREAPAAPYLTELLFKEIDAEEDEHSGAALEALLRIGEAESLKRLGARAEEELVRRIRTDDDSDSPLTGLLMDRYEEIVDEQDNPSGTVYESLGAAFARVEHPNAARLLRQSLQLIKDDDDDHHYTTTSWTKVGNVSVPRIEHHTRDADAGETLELADDVLELDDDTQEWLDDMEGAEFRRVFAESLKGDAKGLEDAAEDSDLRRPTLLAAGLTPEQLAGMRPAARD